MESLEYLKEKRNSLAKELESITVKRHASTAWRPGVQDQYKSESYSYEEYLDPKRAYELKQSIAYLDNQIRTYAERYQEEQRRKEASIPKYNYTVSGKQEATKNPAIAARYDAQNRLFGKSKLEQALLTLTGQKRKFKKLWIKAVSSDTRTQEQVAFEINKMFR